MATTKKSTKAKNNISTSKARSSSTATAKKPATTTKSVRTVKKSVSTKIVKDTQAKKTSVVTKIGTRGNVLQQLQVISGLVTLGLAIVAGLLMSNKAYQLNTGLLAKDELASQTTAVFAPAVHLVYDIELRWVVVGIMALATILPLIYLVRRTRGNEVDLDNRLHFWRWLEAGIITGLMVEVVALLSGIQDVMTLKLIGGVIVISSLLRWVAEKQQAEVSVLRKSTSTLSIILCLLPGILIAGYAIATPVYGMVRSPWYVYALYVTLVTSFIAYVINLRLSLKRPTQNGVTQRNYVVIGLITRVAFAAILIYGLHI